jgi:hypothetical protein
MPNLLTALSKAVGCLPVGGWWLHLFDALL